MDRRQIAAQILPLAVGGIKASLRALLAMLAFTMASAIACYIVADKQWYAVVAPLVFCGAAGVVVAIKHGVLAVVRSAVEKTQLGSRNVHRATLSISCNGSRSLNFVRPTRRAAALTLR